MKKLLNKVKFVAAVVFVTPFFAFGFMLGLIAEYIARGMNLGLELASRRKGKW